MKAAITGGSGFVGGHVSKHLKKNGLEVVNVSRDMLYGDTGLLAHSLAGVDVLINLSGAPIIGRWTGTYRKKIYDSRILTTRKLVRAITLMKEKPGVFLCASAVGIYPEQGTFTEDNTVVAPGFLAELCRDWEHEAMKTASMTRTVILRFGMVLGRGGGSLKKMIIPFRMGLGGKIGSGEQMMSWVHIDDVSKAVTHLLKEKSLCGPVNVTSPFPVSNREFTITLAKTLRRPAFFTVPGFALRLIYGEGASVLTSGQTVIPHKLQQSGFKFVYPRLDQAIGSIYGTQQQS